MNSSLGHGQITGFKSIKVLTRYGDICVCRNSVINRHAIGTEVRRSPRIRLPIRRKEMFVAAQCKALPLSVEIRSSSLQAN